MKEHTSGQPFTFDENTAFMTLGGMCLVHAVIWFALRDPSSSADPFVGAEGLTFFALFFVALGALRRRGQRNQAQL